jgi:hypothetical protein
MDVLTDMDKRHTWLGQTFANVIDSTDKAFGEPRVEDRQEIVRAKIGLEADWTETEGTDWKIPSNFRIPLPALARRANLFIDLTTSPASNDVSNITEDNNSSLSIAYLKKLTKEIDVQLKFDVYGGWDIGPKVVFRYDKKWDSWAAYLEQQAFWRTDDGWGGRSSVNLDYVLPDKGSYIRWANQADYYEALFETNLHSALIYRRRFYWDIALSAEIGANWNNYNGDPEKKNTYTPPDTGVDDDRGYAQLMFVGTIWRKWIEWEVKPIYYYKWEQDDPWRWGLNVRLSVLYEALLGGGQP